MTDAPTLRVVTASTLATCIASSAVTHYLASAAVRLQQQPNALTLPTMPAPGSASCLTDGSVFVELDGSMDGRRLGMVVDGFAWLSRRKKLC